MTEPAVAEMYSMLLELRVLLRDVMDCVEYIPRSLQTRVDTALHEPDYKIRVVNGRKRAVWCCEFHEYGLDRA